MATILHLPEQLLRRIRSRSEDTGQGLTETFAQLLERGLAVSGPAPLESDTAVIITSAESGLPCIECRHAATEADEMTPERVAEVLLESE